MAKSKIESLIKFVSSGAGKVVGEAKSIGKTVGGASAQIEQMHKQINKIARGVSFQSTVTAIQGIAGAFKTVAGVASSAFDFINEKANEADRIGKFSRLLGISAEELQQFRSAGQDAGMAVERVDESLKKFGIAASKAAGGNKEALAVFNALGVKTKDAKGNIRELPSLILAVSDAYKKMTSEADKNRVSQVLFGESGVQMSEMLSGGSENLLKQIEAYKARGGGITNAMAKAGEEFAHSFQFASEAVGGVVNRMTAGLVPALTKVADKIVSFVTENRKELDAITEKVGGSLVGLIEEIDGYLPNIFNAVVGVASVASSIISKVTPFVPEIAAITAGVGGILTAVAAIKAVVIGISFVVGGVAGPIAGIIAGVSGIAYGVYEIYKNFDMVKSFIVDDVWGAMKRLDAYVDERIETFFKNLVDGLRNFVKSVPVIGNLIFGNVDFSSVTSSNQSATSDFMNSIASKGYPADAQSVVKQVSESKSTTTNRLNVDFSNVPAGTSITPSKDFDYNVIDLSAGYAFAP